MPAIGPHEIAVGSGPASSQATTEEPDETVTRHGPSPRNEITTQDLTEAKARLNAGIIDSTSLKKLEDTFCEELRATLRALLVAID